MVPARARNDSTSGRFWLDALHEQVLTVESQSLDLQPAVETLACSLAHAGYAPERLSVSILTEHPGLSGLAYVWKRIDGKVSFLERPVGFLEDAEHQASPIHHVLATRESLFLDANAIVADSRFPIVQEFLRLGATSYLALPVFAVRGDVHVLALWTARPGGWTPQETTQIARVMPLLTLLIDVTENRRLLGQIGTAHELTQRALAEQALRNADALMRQQATDLARLEAERRVRLAAELALEERSRDLAERNAELNTLTASLEDNVKARTRELEEALARAHSATLAKSRFLAMMSHEIRTPMHGVLGLAEALGRTPLDADQRSLLDTIQTSGTALLYLLNDILDFSRIEADRMAIASVPVEPGRLLDDVSLLLRGSAEARGLGLEVRCHDDVPAVVKTDPTRLRQVWINLISNALKFTDTGGVSAVLEVAARTRESVTLRGQVHDTGPGIPGHMLDRLFEPFYQGDDATGRRLGGAGLGLAICKRLLEQMGGSLRVESTPGEGSVFSFLLPVEAQSHRWPDPVPPAVAMAADLTGLRMLVVDDNAVNRLVAQRQLDALGVRSVVIATSGEEALEQIQAGSFDAVLMDVQMPGMDGMEATRQVRRLPLARQPCIIAMTANAFEEDRRACTAAGMNGFVSKPMSLADLREALGAAQAG